MAAPAMHVPGRISGRAFWDAPVGVPELPLVSLAREMFSVSSTERPGQGAALVYALTKQPWASPRSPSAGRCRCGGNLTHAAAGPDRAGDEINHEEPGQACTEQR